MKCRHQNRDFSDHPKRCKCGSFARGCANSTEPLRIVVLRPNPGPWFHLSRLLFPHCDCDYLWPSLQTPSSPPQMFDFNLVVGKNLWELQMETLKVLRAFTAQPNKGINKVPLTASLIIFLLPCWFELFLVLYIFICGTGPVVFLLPSTSSA